MSEYPVNAGEVYRSFSQPTSSVVESKVGVNLPAGLEVVDGVYTVQRRGRVSQSEKHRVKPYSQEWFERLRPDTVRFGFVQDPNGEWHSFQEMEEYILDFWKNHPKLINEAIINQAIGIIRGRMKMEGDLNYELLLKKIEELPETGFTDAAKAHLTRAKAALKK